MSKYKYMLFDRHPHQESATLPVKTELPKIHPKVKVSLWDIWPSVLNGGGQMLRLWLRHEVIRHDGQFPGLAVVVCSGANALKSRPLTPILAAVAV